MGTIPIDFVGNRHDSRPWRAVLENKVQRWNRVTSLLSDSVCSEGIEIFSQGTQTKY
jgi:hypothetical protein